MFWQDGQGINIPAGYVYREKQIKRNQQSNTMKQQDNKWMRMETDKNTGLRVLTFTGMTNGLFVAPSDLGDEDALREIQEID